VTPAALVRKINFHVQVPPATVLLAEPGRCLLPTSSARTIITSPPPVAAHLDAEPRPAFLEMVGRLAAAYCPPLLSTDVVEVARSALVGRADRAMDEVETVARAALDVAVARPVEDTPHEDLQP
jgi:hypothetical protein